MSEFMTVQEFKMIFSEFENMGAETDEIIDFYLDQAESYVCKTVFRNFTKMGHGYKTAELLAASPYARTIRQDGQESNYTKQFQDLLDTCAPRAVLL